MAKPLSPAAQVVWNAFKEAPICAEVKLAAALRAVADQLPMYAGSWQESECTDHTRSGLLALAAELIGTTTRSEND